MNNREQELAELEAKATELRNHLTSGAFYALEEDRIEQQLAHMEAYANLLRVRIEEMSRANPAQT
jgi:Tfp pilus assembly protein PilO